MQTIDVKITGTRPLLMDNARKVDPLDPLTIEINRLDRLPTSRKTDETLAEADRLRFAASLYVDENDLVYLPAENFYGCLVETAKLFRLGPKAKSGLSVLNDSPLIGLEKSASELIEDKSFWFRKRVNRKPKSVMSVRPIFHSWGALFSVEYFPEVIGHADVELILKTCGRVGLGSWRQVFGKFEVEF